MPLPVILGTIARGLAGAAVRMEATSLLRGGLDVGQLAITETPRMEVSVKDNIDEAIRDMNYLQRQAVPNAVVRALNRTIQSCQREGMGEIAQQMGTTQKVVKSRLNQHKATRILWEAHIVPFGKPFRLAHFTPRKTAAGVTASAWGKRKLYRHTFLTHVQAGDGVAQGVFVRKTKKCFPIKQLYGPGVVQTFKDPRVMRVMEATADRRFPKEFEANLTYYSSRLK